MLIPSTPRQPPEIPNGRATHGQSARLAARPDYTVVNTSNFDESSSNGTLRVPLTNAVPKAVIQPPQRSQTPKDSPTTEARPQGQKRPADIALPLMVPSESTPLRTIRPLFEPFGPPTSENAPVALHKATIVGYSDGHQASDQRANHSFNNALGPAPAPSDRTPRKPKAGPIIVHDDQESSTTSCYPKWEIPFLGKNHYTGTTMELLRKTIHLEAHQCFLPVDASLDSCPTTLNTTEVGILVPEKAGRIWTALFLTIQDGEWRVRYFNANKNTYVEGHREIRKHLGQLFLSWCKIVGRPPPNFQWTEEVTYFPHPPFQPIITNVLQTSLRQDNADSCGPLSFYFLRKMFGRGTITPANPVFLRLQQKKAVEHWMNSQCGGNAPLPRIPMPQIKGVQQGRRPLAILPQPQVNIRENRLGTLPEGKVSKSSSWDAEDMKR
ncbi:MAG: hypothetical protein Q9180_001489 [Flavoplaca navasiana]